MGEIDQSIVIPDKSAKGVAEEKDDVEKRTHLMERLKPDQQALFRFLEHLRKIEIEATDLPVLEAKPKIQWQYGVTTEAKIQMALISQGLPLQYDDHSRYEVMSWLYTIDQNDPEVKVQLGEMEPETRLQFVNSHFRGCRDLRISLTALKNGKKTLYFFSN